MAWDTKHEVEFLRKLNGVQAEGVGKGQPKIETAIDACEMILTLAPETNGHVAKKAWQALGKATGRDHTQLINASEHTQIRFHDIANDQIIAYSKVDAITGNAVLVVINLDPTSTQEGMLRFDASAVGLGDGAVFEVHDLITGETYTWTATETGNFIRLAPEKNVAHIFRLPEVPRQRREALAYRQISDHDYRP